MDKELENEIDFSENAKQDLDCSSSNGVFNDVADKDAKSEDCEEIDGLMRDTYNNPQNTEKKDKDESYIDKSKRYFDIFYMCIVAICMIVMWSTGVNFLPLIVIVFGVGAALIIFIRVLKRRGISLYLWISYIIAIGGTFLYFLIWGAESFGENFWWNLLLSLFPIIFATIAYMANSVVPKKVLRAIAAMCTILMAGTAMLYFFFMNLRVKTTVESLQEGQDGYLEYISSNYTTNSSSPNVLVILMDDMAYSDISVYSYLNSVVSDGTSTSVDTASATINTPNIDSIAENGIIMDNFYSSSPVCSPSRFSLLTGRYSSRGYLDNVVFPTDIESTPYSSTHFYNPYQFLNNVDGILGDEITFAEVLQAAGYNTGCIGKWNLGDYGEYLPTNQGFDYFYGSYYVNDMTPYTWVCDTADGEHEVVRTHAENLDQSESTELFTDEVLNFISSSAENDEKFLAYYTTPWPHYPIYSNNSGNGYGDTTDDTYIDCIEEFDKYLGEILNYLKNTQDASGNGSLYDNTLIIFTSDNGPGREGVTGSLRGRKNTTFEGGMKVPIIASYPNGGLGSGTENTEQVTYSIYDWVGTIDDIANMTKSTTATTAATTHIESSAMNFDLFNTILKYCGILDEYGNVYLPSDRVIDGVSLYDLWQCDTSSAYRVHQKLFYLKKGKCQAIQMAVELDGVIYDFKYYDKVLTENSAFIDQYYVNYLFNLDTDPAEGYSISKTYPEIAIQLKAELEAFREEMETNRRGIL